MRTHQVMQANSAKSFMRTQRSYLRTHRSFMRTQKVMQANSSSPANELRGLACELRERPRMQAPRDTKGVQTSDSGAGRSGGGPELPADSNDVDRAAGAAGPACALIGGWSNDFTWIHGDLRL